jgi:tRNA A37 methylthiotransferase MiaB
MRALLAKSQAAYQQQFLGQEMEVLWESVSFKGDKGWLMHGLTDNYMTVQVWSDVGLWNTTSPVKLLAAEPETLVGKILS